MAEISLCMAVYNGEKFIEKQLKSILKQTIVPNEIIISDDGSTDNTVNLIKATLPTAKIIINPSKGIVSNFENALKHSTGKYIFLSDQDDEWQQNKIEKIMPLFAQYPLIIHDAEIIDESSQSITTDSFFQLRNSKSGIINNLIKSTYLGCCMAFTRTVLEKALPFPKNIEMHDRWLGLIGEISGGAYFYPEKLIGYRRHGKNASGGFNKSKYGKLKQLSIRTYMAKELIKRYLSTK